MTVQTQPTGELCQVASGASGMNTGSVGNVTVVCAFGQWTWEGGLNSVNASGLYGTLGTAAAGNVPGARYWTSSWTDSSGNFWLFGGLSPAPIYASPSTSTGLLNDVWMYNLQSGLWTWVGGSNEVWGLFSGSGGSQRAVVPHGIDRLRPAHPGP